MPRLAFLLAFLSVTAPLPCRAGEAVGQRPYEMVWANRTQDTRPALVDFEDLEGWTVEKKDSEALWSRSREQQIWGDCVGKLVYRATGRQPAVTIRPPKPVPVAGPVDCVNLWLYGNNWGWAPDATTPAVGVDVLLAAPSGTEVRVHLGAVRWKEWWLMHARLAPDQTAALKDGGAFAGLRITGGRNKDDRALYFDNLAVYQEPLAPLEFEPRPKRGIEPFPGQTTGTNTGPGKLPFPTREETILPDNLTADFKTTLEQQGDEHVFRYRGADGELVYRYRPATGTLGDVTAEWVGRGAAFKPMSGGGVLLASPDKPAPAVPENLKLVRCEKKGDTVESVWQCPWAGKTIEVAYTLRLWQKSLVVDVKCLGGYVGEVRFGTAAGVQHPRLVTLPYLACAEQRPAVLVMGPAERPLFLMGLVDHCRSNASTLFAVNETGDKTATYNGGSRYVAKTDGRRNDCFERLFLTVSPRFEEVLPNVPNPRSPWMHVAGERVWRAHGAHNREQDYALWKKVARYGMSKVLVTDHETGWRDGGESFTFRTRAAPGKGGDEGQADYARKIRALGFRYGIYNNYTDYAPVNEHWHEDRVTRQPDGNWRTAWPRCYNPKPARAVEFEARLAPVIQKKFQIDTAYCDVHTAVRPWDYVDYDARVPGAGTFAATLYAYGEIMLHQKQTWNGPVYSEGNNHWYYCGLTDGNYGQDQAAKLDESPWLVDFDLRKLHPLCCNFGMGNLGMFYGREEGLGSTPEERDRRLDRFLAATLAFGHTGFLVMEGGMSNAARSYFALQQIHAAYAQQAPVEIHYRDEKGNLLDTSAAVASGAFRRSQVVTTYSNGLKVWVNGHPTETWGMLDVAWRTLGIDLPPNGWCVHDSSGKLTAYSALVRGRRVDYVSSPAYLYADGRGQFTRFREAATDGQLVALHRPDGAVEVIPIDRCTELGVSLDGRAATAVALDEEGKEIGPAATRFARWLVYVDPTGANDASRKDSSGKKPFSYLLRPGKAPEVVLRCDHDQVVPGETVEILGKNHHAYQVPADAKPGTRHWVELEGAWIDFTLVPLVEATLEHAGDSLRLRMVPRLAETSEASLTLAGQTRTARLVPGQPVEIEWPLERPKEEEVRELKLAVKAGELTMGRSWWLTTEHAVVARPLPADYQAGQRLRRAEEEKVSPTTGAIVHRRETSCGDVARPSLFMHPPYKTGPGYAFALFDPIDLPAGPKAVLRCQIGKEDGSDPGDGILFRVAVIGPDGKEAVAAEKQWVHHAWTDFEADLSRWAGQRVRVKLVADVGPADNSSGDWAAWADLRIEPVSPELRSALHDQPVALRRAPGPHMLDGLRVEDLRKAKKARLHFQGIGLQNGGQYVSEGRLNDVPLGPLPGAGGNEVKGVWADAAIELTADAIAGLTAWNRLRIHNPGGDHFAVRRFWIELELADGRRCSSQVTAAAYTQPPGWPHGEGTGVPMGEDIETEICLPAAR